MPNIFDLTKITKMIESQRPVCILVVDTNILMEEPDFSKWSVTAGPTLFVLSDLIIRELENIRHKPEAREKALKARRSLTNLFKEGTITEGIPVNVGWVISVPSPKQDELDLGLKQLEDIVKAFGRSDTKLLILTKECSQSFESTPVILLTADQSLYLTAQMNGIPCHSYTRFPIEDLKEITEKLRDWDRSLQDMQVTTKQNSIVVEATLTTYRSAPPWLMTGTKSLIIAEGHGVMRDGTKNRHFLWTIPFYAQTVTGSSEKSTLDLPSIFLDFLGEDDFEQPLFDAIADRLLDCVNITFEEGKPTLQNPESVLKMLLFIRDEEQDDTACLEGFIQAFTDCWKIGQTYRFRIMRDNKVFKSE